MHLQMPSVESRKGQLQKDTPSSTHRPALAAPRRAEAAWRLKPREAVPTSLSKVRIWASSGASPGVKLLFPSKTPCGWLPLRVAQLSCWGLLWVYYDNLIHSLSWGSLSPIPSRNKMCSRQLWKFMWSRIPFPIFSGRNPKSLQPSNLPMVPPWGGRWAWVSKSPFLLPGERALAALHGARVLPAGLLGEQEGAKENFPTICGVCWLPPGGLWLAFWSEQVRLMQAHLLHGFQRHMTQQVCVLLALPMNATLSNWEKLMVM